MKKLLLIGLIMLAMISLVSAENCFTGISVPTGDKYYWKAISYSGIRDSNYNDYLTRTDTPSDQLVIGPGNAYTMRLDANCFQGYLLSNVENTGITSSQINIQARDKDYYTTNFIVNKLYTISVQPKDSVSTKRVYEITNGYVEGIDYLALPSTFQEPNKHPDFESMMIGVCDSNLKITEQLEHIKEAIWKEIDYTESASSCSKTNIIDCVLANNKGTDQEYSALFMTAARRCGVPTRVVKGISEATFDGVDLYFPREKSHYWVEFYDGTWFEKEVLESGPGVPSSIENNCQDGIDNNQDGYVDCWDDECSESYACSAWVTTSVFKNAYSTDLTQLPNPYSVNNLTVGNEHGSVTWINQSLDLRGLQLETGVNIAPNLININDLIPALDKPATAQINNLQAGNKKILKNLAACSECKLINDTITSITFTIPGKGRYTIQQANTNTTNTTIVPVPVASTKPGANIIAKIKNTYNKLTNLSKILIVIAILGAFWLYRRKKNRQARFRGRY